MLLLPRVPEWWFIALACIRSGIIAIPAPIMLSERDIGYRIAAADAKMLFTIPEVIPKVDAGFKIAGHSDCKRVACIQATSPKVPLPEGWSKFSDLVKNASNNHQCIDSLADDSMMSYFTSGTTGLPKMVDLTHGFALGHNHSTKPFIGMKPKELIWVLADPGWVATIYGALFPPWYSKGTVLAQYSPPAPPVWGSVFEVLKKFPIEHFVTPPTVYRMLLQEKLPSAKELEHVKNYMTGGEPLNSETYYAWKKAFGREIREVYGQTETPGLIGMMPGTKYKPGSFGKPLGYTIDILDENGNPLPVGEEGDIGIRMDHRRPFLFKGYVGNPEANAKVFKNGYYFTGDRARYDEDGYLFFSSRSDDVMISSGYRIGPFEVESAILEHPAVVESAAVSSPDKDRGEVVKAFIVLKPEYKDKDKNILASEIQATVKKITAPYKYPRKIEFVDELPKTISGKIKRADLREKEWAKH